MMVELMKIEETEDVLNLWEKKTKEITNLDHEVDEYKDAMEEAIGHANIYVHHNKQKRIDGFAMIIEGVYMSDLIYPSKDVGIEIIDILKERYDEIQTDVHIDHPANELLPKLGFSFREKAVHDVMGYSENEYEWLK